MKVAMAALPAAFLIMMWPAAGCQTSSPPETSPAAKTDDGDGDGESLAPSEEPRGIARDEVLYREAGSGPDPVEWLSGELQDENPRTGIAVGETVPDFRGRDHNGNETSFASVRGERGAVLVFHRSADW